MLSLVNQAAVVTFVVSSSGRLCLLWDAAGVDAG